ncbi:MAG: tRNA (adenosine(37)-N6)-threonylcarbamoyltransferase complex ATPase subunit type 1 TsaE [Spirochaetes bacterium]|nr:tRNA (adenosine(37)-N6)-threonylcarbamoyltransferase complex ATPase subunit type 1 TsaE [Spirochaetota bacterium]
MRRLCPTLDATREFARELLTLLEPGQCWILDGAVGAGKTTFTRLLLGALEYRGLFQSPTFTLVQEYGPFPPRLGLVRHADFYRLPPGTRAESLGSEEWFEDGSLIFVEWAQRLPGFEALATHRLSIEPAGGEARLFVAHRLAP